MTTIQAEWRRSGTFEQQQNELNIVKWTSPALTCLDSALKDNNNNINCSAKVPTEILFKR